MNRSQQILSFPFSKWAIFCKGKLLWCSQRTTTFGVGVAYTACEGRLVHTVKNMVNLICESWHSLISHTVLMHSTCTGSVTVLCSDTTMFRQPLLIQMYARYGLELASGLGKEHQMQFLVVKSSECGLEPRHDMWVLSKILYYLNTCT